MNLLNVNFHMALFLFPSGNSMERKFARRKFHFLCCITFRRNARNSEASSKNSKFAVEAVYEKEVVQSISSYQDFLYH